MNVEFNDSAGLDSAYYQVDNFTGGMNVANSIPIFTALNATDFIAGFTFNISVWNSIIEGNHTIYFLANDTIGNYIDDPIYALQFYKDITPPTILILSSNNTAYQLAPWVNVEFSDQMGASDGNLSAAYFKIDSYVPAGTSLAGWTTIFSNVNYYQNQTGFQFPASVWNPLSDDNHTMWFKVFDHAGNIFESNTTSWIFIKDTTPPTVTVNTTQIYYNADPTITATFNDMTSLNWSYYSVYNGSFNSAWIPIFYNITINYNISTILLKFRHLGLSF